MRTKGLLICIIGIDGSGKTTLARHVVAMARDLDMEMKIVWCKFESSLFRLLIALKNRFFIREKDWRLNYEQSLRLKHRLMQRALPRFFYQSFIFIAYRLQILYKVQLPLFFGTHIVCDRYVFDTFVDLAKDLDYSDEYMIQGISRYFRWVPYPDLLLSMDIPAEIAIQRKSDIPSLEFLIQKQKRYERIIQHFESVRFDGTASISELTNTLEGYIRKLVGRYNS